MKALPQTLKDTLQSVYNGLAEQYESIDETIKSRQESIKSLKKMKKEIEADMAALEEMGVGVLDESEPVVEEVVENGEKENT